VAKKNGAEARTFELCNFNIGRGPFPRPDDHFRAALRCEVIEHLQSDPMHLL
jgi:hypothetical protein